MTLKCQTQELLLILKMSHTIFLPVPFYNMYLSIIHDATPSTAGQATLNVWFICLPKDV